MTYNDSICKVQLKCEDSDTITEIAIPNAGKDEIRECLQEAHNIVMNWLEDENNVPDGYENCTCDIEFYITCLEKHFGINYEDAEVMTWWY